MNENNFHNSIGKPIAGIGLVMLWFFVLSIPLVQITSCTQGDEDAWLVSLFLFLPASLICVGLAFLGTKEETRIKWLSLPFFGLLPWAGYTALEYMYGTTISGNHLCTVLTGEIGFNSYPSSWWAGFWGPTQLIIVMIIIWCLVKYWWRHSN